jgi:hypothetical protein
MGVREMRNFMRKLAFAGASLALAGAASASDPYAALVSAVSFTSVITDVVAVAALVIAVLVAIRAVRFIYSIVRR